MLLSRVLLVWLAAIVVWQWVGRWEWTIPEPGREKLTAWRTQYSTSRTLEVTLELGDASELETHYWKLRRRLRQWEIEQGGPLWLRLIVRVREGSGKSSLYERRFSAVECRVEEV